MPPRTALFLKRSVDTPAVAVAARFDRDAVVAGVEETIFDQDVAGGFGVAAIVVGAVGGDLHAAHGDVLREDGMNFPHW